MEVATARGDREAVPHPSSQVQPSGRISIFAGVFRRCSNEKLLLFPSNVQKRKELKEALRTVVGKSFTVRDVFFANYGPDSGPGIFIALAESTLVLGGWPEKDGSIDFFLHFCGPNEEKAKQCIIDVGAFVGASSITLAASTKKPAYLLTV